MITINAHAYETIINAKSDEIKSTDIGATPSAYYTIEKNMKKKK